jgi:hypothetical protein
MTRSVATIAPVADDAVPDAIFEGTREAWFQKIIDVWRPYFARVGFPLPARIWVSVGKPPRVSATGTCYPGAASDDGSPHIFVHPILSDPNRVAGTLVHQLCHAALGNRSHGSQFKTLATATGLVGKMTQTIEGPMFLTIMPGIIDRIGPYPHASLRQIRGLDKTSNTRLIRINCPGCGYMLRGTQRWLRIAVPACPNPRCPNRDEQMEVG